MQRLQGDSQHGSAQVACIKSVCLQQEYVGAKRRWREQEHLAHAKSMKRCQNIIEVSSGGAHHVCE